MDMDTTTRLLPRWDMSRIYPSIESEAFRAAFEGVTAGIAALRAQFDRDGIHRRDDPRVDAGVAATFEAWIGSLNVEALIERSVLARDHAFPLRKAALAARHQMSELANARGARRGGGDP